MILTHKCPDCGKEHEQDTTPEPDKRCGECELKFNYPIQDDIWPSRRWNKDKTDCIDLSADEDDFRMNNVVKIEFWVGCGNCTMNKDEVSWFIDKIDELCKMRACELKDIKVYD